MAHSTQSILLHSAAILSVIAASVTVPCAANPSADKFLTRSSQRQSIEGTSINTTVSEILASGNGVSVARVATISADLQQMFQSLPKNDLGRLTPRAVRHMVHTYFAREHGWLIRGLEPHSLSSRYSNLHEAEILVDSIPALAAALADDAQCNMGFSYEDAVAMTAAIERAIFDGSLDMLDKAYTFNGKSPKDSLNETELHSVLTSYLLIYESGGDLPHTSVEEHQAFKAKAQEVVVSWPWIRDFEQDSVSNFAYEQRHHTNPFVPQHFSFQATTHIVDMMTKSYGKWQNRECFEMKDVLVGMAGDDSGKVPLGIFYSQQQRSEHTFSFTETEEDLWEMGALEESLKGLMVRIPNYLNGPSNCIAASSYYSVCCLNECELVMHEIENKTKAPSAEPEVLISFLGNMSSSTVDAPRELSEDLRARLYVIAARHAGQVPIYGRLFAEWLHHAFPNECPYPHIAGSNADLAPRRWQGSEGLQAKAKEEDKQKHIGVSAELEHMTEALPVEWLDDEVLPLEEPDVKAQRRSFWLVVLPATAQISVFLAMWSMAAGTWQRAVATVPDRQAGEEKTLEDRTLHI